MNLSRRRSKPTPEALAQTNAHEPVTLSFCLARVLLAGAAPDAAVEAKRATLSGELATVQVRIKNIADALINTPSSTLRTRLGIEEAHAHELQTALTSLPPRPPPRRRMLQPLIRFVQGAHTEIIALDLPTERNAANERLLITLARTLGRIDSVLLAKGDLMTLETARELVPATRFELAEVCGPVVSVGLTQIAPGKWLAHRTVTHEGQVIETAALTKEPLPLAHFVTRFVSAVRGLGAVEAGELGARVMASVGGAS